MSKRGKKCQNVSKPCFLTLFFDTRAPAREVCKFVSKRVKKRCVSKNVCTRPRVKKQNHRFRMMFRDERCQNVSRTHFLILFFDTCPLLREVCKFVSKSLTQIACQTMSRNMCVSKRVNKHKRPNNAVVRVSNLLKYINKCQKSISKSICAPL